VAHPFLAGSDVVMSNEEVYSVSNRLMAAGVDGMVEWVTVRDSTMQTPTP
jgi:hypothetical protein